jgi:hypothetical protein
MPVPGLTVVAEGETAHGERWYLKAGGSAHDYYTLLETIYPDGHRDEGGMGGPAIYPGNLLNVYTGRAGLITRLADINGSGSSSHSQC